MDPREVQPFRIERRQQDGQHVVAPTGEVDLATAGELGEALTAAVRDGGPLRLDLAEVSFLDSSGLRVILGAHQEAQDRGTPFVVSGASPAIRRLLELTGVAGVVDGS